MPPTHTPRHDPTIFKIHFGLVAVKAHTKALGCGRILEKFPDIRRPVGRHTERFATLVECEDVGAILDGLLDTLPRPTHIWTYRVGAGALDFSL